MPAPTEHEVQRAKRKVDSSNHRACMRNAVPAGCARGRWEQGEASVPNRSLAPSTHQDHPSKSNSVQRICFKKPTHTYIRPLKWLKNDLCGNGISKLLDKRCMKIIAANPGTEQTRQVRAEAQSGQQKPLHALKLSWMPRNKGHLHSRWADWKSNVDRNVARKPTEDTDTCFQKRLAHLSLLFPQVLLHWPCWQVFLQLCNSALVDNAPFFFFLAFLRT